MTSHQSSPSGRVDIDRMVAELEMLVRIPSISRPGYPTEPMGQAADAVLDLFRRSGLEDIQLLGEPLRHPAIYGHLPAPAGAPTLLLYAHYDVQPVGDIDAWRSDPWTPILRDGRLYGRGTADDKAGIVMHAETVRVLAATGRIGIKILIEGEEETESLLPLVLTPKLAACDAAVVADAGNLIAGKPCLTTSLRGIAHYEVTLKVGSTAPHSGLFGGVARDAVADLMGLLLAARTQLDADSDSGDGEEAATDLLEAISTSGVALREDLGPVDARFLARRLWRGSALGIQTVEHASSSEPPNAVPSMARARISLRLPPGQSVEDATARLRETLLGGCRIPDELSLSMLRGRAGLTAGSGDYAAMVRALEAAYGIPPALIGSGASVPAAALIQSLAPGADLVVLGPQDLAQSHTHAPNESVDVLEMARLATAQVHLGNQMAAAL